MNFLSKIKEYKLSEIFFWLFLVSLPFNKRVIYYPEQAYIHGYFSYYLAVFLYVSDLLLLICFMCNIIENWPNIRDILPRLGKYLVISLVFLVSGLLGWFHMKHLDILQVYNLVKLTELIILVYLTSQTLKSLTNLKISLFLIYISAILQGILGLLQFHVQHQVGFSFLGEYVSQLGTGGLATIDTITGKVIRAYGTFPHPNILGTFLNIGLAIGYYLVSPARTTDSVQSGGRATKAKYWLILANFILVLGIFTSFSRVAWVVSCATTLIYLGYQYCLTKKLFYWPILIPAVVGVVCILIFDRGLLLARVSNITDSNSYIERVAYNAIGWEIWKTHSLGVGIGNYIPTMLQSFHVQPWDYQPPHNIFIYLGASFGWIGLGTFIIFLFTIASKLWRAKSSDIRLLLLVVLGSLVVMSMFDHFLVTIQQGQLMFALVFGTILAYDNLEKHASSN